MNIKSTILNAVAILTVAIVPAYAQGDVTTRNATSAWGGGYITGPASNPLSFLNGDSYRTLSSESPYLLPDFAPVSLANAQLPRWISFASEERFRFEGYHDSGSSSTITIHTCSTACAIR
jgi:hypothetical protein